MTGCEHLAVAAEGRDFVRRCVELCQGEKQWRALCESRHQQGLASGEWSPEREDYTWLETAFCEEFLKAADVVRRDGIRMAVRAETSASRLLGAVVVERPAAALVGVAG